MLAFVEVGHSRGRTVEGGRGKGEIAKSNKVELWRFHRVLLGLDTSGNILLDYDGSKPLGSAL